MSPVVDRNHPSPNQLAAFARGGLSDQDEQQIETHLAGCDSCCRTLSGLSDDTIVGLLRDDQAAGGETIAPSPPPELANHPRYELQELLGAGGMGTVYKAQHRMMNRPVALKVINEQLVRNGAAVQRFHREVQAAARLTHPNIVTAYDAEQAGNLHFLVMEYVDGLDLAEVVRRRGPLPVAEASDYIRQAALGLEHAHRHGMVHRDIKPQNLIAGKDEGGRMKDEAEVRVKILDFGLAGFATLAVLVAEASFKEQEVDRPMPAHLTRHGSMMGTPDYISPEQSRDAHTADIRSDIYSLGCTLYYLLSGEPPFAGGSVLEKVLAHENREPRLLSELRQDLPPGLEAVLRRMIAKNPADRFQTPAELAAAIAPFAMPRAGIPPPRPRKRNMVLIATLLVALFAALAGVLVVVTDRGILHIQSEVDDVQIVVTSGGKEVAAIDARTGSQIRWLPTGEYQIRLAGPDTDIQLDAAGFRMTRLGRVIVTARWNTADLGTLHAIAPAEEPISQDDVTAEDGGWRIAAAGERSVRMFEVTPPPLAKGPFFYRAKLKSQEVQGKAYLEMWVRIPGRGEFFSKGLERPITGTNGWAEYEIPFFLQAGQQPDLIKLNVTLEGAGTVWIKDVELRPLQKNLWVELGSGRAPRLW